MFSPLIIAYLFLAGTGCGTFVSATLLSQRARTAPSLRSAFEPVAFSLLVVSCGMVVVGSVCLVLDLGRPELALSVLANPFGSVLSVGAWALVIFSLADVALMAHALGVVSFGGVARAVLKIVGCAMALAVMVYSGLFLSWIDTLPFLASPLVPVLFVCSSLSCGAGVVFIMPLLRGSASAPLWHRMARVDGAILVLEAAALVALLVVGYIDPLSTDAVLRMLAGDLAGWFWLGLVGVGLVAPFAFEVVLRARCNEVESALVGVMLLIGGVALRTCLCIAPFGDVISYLS